MPDGSRPAAFDAPKRTAPFGNERGKPLIDRIMDRVAPEPNSGCWLWMFNVSKEGYAKLGNRRSAVHRTLYEILVGPVLDGLELDHKCRVRCCVNPAHLEPVTHAENVRRGMGGENMRQKTCCPKGHPYGTDNTVVQGDGFRRCRECLRLKAMRQRRARAINASR